MGAMASTKVSIYVRLGVIITLFLLAQWEVGLFFSRRSRVRLLHFLLFYVSVIFLWFCAKKWSWMGIEQAHPTMQSTKSTSEPVNNFDIFYKQLNIYFTNVWHPQENNSRSATAHPFFVSLQEIYKKFNSIILFFYLAHYWQVMFHLSCFKLYFYRQNDEPLLCEFAVKILARLDIIPGSTTAWCNGTIAEYWWTNPHIT